MSGRAEIEYEPDSNIYIEEFKLQSTDTEEITNVGKGSIIPVNIDQKFQEQVKKRKNNCEEVETNYPCDVFLQRHVLLM